MSNKKKMTLLIDVSLTHDVEIDYPDDEVSRMLIDDTTRYMFLKTFDGTGFEVKDLDMKFVEEKPTVIATRHDLN